MGNDFFTVRKRVILGYAKDPGSGGPTWNLGVVGAKFAGDVVTDIYSSLSAKVTVAVFRGTRELPSRTSTRRVVGRQTIRIPGPLSRGSYRLRITGQRPGEQRRIWSTLRV